MSCSATRIAVLVFMPFITCVFLAIMIIVDLWPTQPHLDQFGLLSSIKPLIIAFMTIYFPASIVIIASPVYIIHLKLNEAISIKFEILLFCCAFIALALYLLIRHGEL